MPPRETGAGPERPRLQTYGPATGPEPNPDRPRRPTLCRAARPPEASSPALVLPSAAAPAHGSNPRPGRSRTAKRSISLSLSLSLSLPLSRLFQQASGYRRPAAGRQIPGPKGRQAPAPVRAAAGLWRQPCHEPSCRQRAGTPVLRTPPPCAPPAAAPSLHRRYGRR